jgi:hypothetical protein
MSGGQTTEGGTMKWEIVQVTTAATETAGYQTRSDGEFTSDEAAARREIERRATASGLKCFACRMDGRRGCEHLRAPSGHYITSEAGTI